MNPSAGNVELFGDEYSKFVSDPKNMGIGIKCRLNKNFVSYELGAFLFGVTFLNEEKYNVEVRNEETLEKEFPIPYIHSTEIDYHAIFQNACGLTKKLTDSK